MWSGGWWRQSLPAIPLFFSSSTLTFEKSLVFLSHSWGCRTAPPVILLTYAHTISVCLSVFSPQEAQCAEQSFVKTLSSFYPALSSPHFLKPLYFQLTPLLFDAQSANRQIKKHTMVEGGCPHRYETSRIRWKPAKPSICCTPIRSVGVILYL